MCELFGMSASTPVKVCYDLDAFAKGGGERHLNRDGWGIVYADDKDAHYFREAAPAKNSPLARFVREQTEPHATVLAHVRRATTGKRLLANTHPFRRVQNGRVHHFAHNGELHGIDDVPANRRFACDRVGDTDSELAFLILLDRLAQTGTDSDDIASCLDLFRDFAAEMAELGPANFLWFDGRTLFAHADRRKYETENGLTSPRSPGLHVLRSENAQPEGQRSCEGARFQTDADHVTLVASVPLSDGPWEPLQERTVLAIRDGQIWH